MSAQFDPYHRWLGVPPEKQPPNHYALLAIEPFEDSADVIESAGDQRMAHLRNFQAGEHGDLSQKLLNEVAAAKICLLNPDKKAVYDRKLREEIEAAKPVVPKAVPAKLAPAGQSVQVETGEETSVAQFARQRRSQFGPIVIGGVTAAAVIGGLILWALNSGNRPADDDKDVAQQGNTTAPSDPTAVGDAGLDGAVLPARVDPPPEDVPPTDPGDTPPDSDDSPTELAAPADPPEGDPPDDPPETTPPENTTGPEPPPRQPIPSSTAQAEVTRQLDEIYKFAEVKTSAKKLALADQLLKLAGEANENPAEQFVLLRKAMELATDGGDAALMLGAIDAIAVDFEIDALAVKQKVLPKVAQAATDAAKLALLAEGSLAVVDEATACHRYDVAHAVIEAAYRACQRSEGREYRKQIYDRRKEVQKLHAAWQQFQKALVTLNTTPDDAEANLAVGRWYCFTLGDWRQALPHFSKCSDVALKLGAELELASPSDTPQQVTVADAWWTAAEGVADEAKPALLLRAGYWYEQARPDVTSVLLKGKLEKRLAEISQIGQPHDDVAGRKPDSEKPPTAGTRLPKVPVRRVTFRDPTVLKSFICARPQDAKWSVANGQMLIQSNGDTAYVTYREYFKSISSVTIRGGIVPPGNKCFRVCVGPVWLILNWASRDENHFRDGGLGATTAPSVTQPGALVSGRPHEIRVAQSDGKTVVTIDGQQYYTTTAPLEGTVTIYAAHGSTIAVQEIVIEGEPDPNRVVVGPSHVKGR